MLIATESDREFFPVPFAVFTGWEFFFLPRILFLWNSKDSAGNVTLFPHLKMHRKCHVTTATN